MLSGEPDHTADHVSHGHWCSSPEPGRFLVWVCVPPAVSRESTGSAIYPRVHEYETKCYGQRYVAPVRG